MALLADLAMIPLGLSAGVLAGWLVTTWLERRGA